MKANKICTFQRTNKVKGAQSATVSVNFKNDIEGQKFCELKGTIWSDSDTTCEPSICPLYHLMMMGKIQPESSIPPYYP